MLIYEKENKLNISFENNIEDTDIQIGKDEVKIGEATISENNVLPVATEEDVGKVPTVQSDGSYALAEAGANKTFVIPILWDDNKQAYYTTAEYEDVKAAVIAEKSIVFKTDTTGNIYANRLSDVDEDGSFYALGSVTYDNTTNICTIVVSYKAINDKGVVHVYVQYDNLFSSKWN